MTGEIRREPCPGKRERSRVSWEFGLKFGNQQDGSLPRLGAGLKPFGTNQNWIDFDIGPVILRISFKR